MEKVEMFTSKTQEAFYQTFDVVSSTNYPDYEVIGARLCNSKFATGYLNTNNGKIVVQLRNITGSPVAAGERIVVYFIWAMKKNIRIDNQ